MDKSQIQDTQVALNSKEAAYVNVKPFWVCPRGLFWHSLYIASQSRLQYPSHLVANVLGNGALIALVVQYEKLPYYLLIQLMAWMMWLLIPDARFYLTPPELRDVIDLPPPSMMLPF